MIKKEETVVVNIADTLNQITKTAKQAVLSKAGAALAPGAAAAGPAVETATAGAAGQGGQAPETGSFLAPVAQPARARANITKVTFFIE